jgi:AAA domain/UvrD-like helicase C-terminal domain
MLYTKNQVSDLRAKLVAFFPEEQLLKIDEIAEQLTDEQKYCYGSLLLWYFDKENTSEFHLLSGAAGTGKSFLVGRFVLAAKQIAALRANDFGSPMKFSTCLVAPTHKATGVLHDVFTDIPYVPTIGTVHSLLHLRPGKVNEHGERPLEMNMQSGKEHFSKFTLGICDEDSMLSEELLGFVEEGSGFNQKVLFVGDRYQLPPVEKFKEELPKEYIQKSPIFTRGYPEVVLVTPQRYGGAIADFATDIRFRIEHIYLVAAIKKFIAGEMNLDEVSNYLKSEYLWNEINPKNADVISYLAHLSIDGSITPQVLKKLQKVVDQCDYSLPFPPKVEEGEETNLHALTGTDWNSKLVQALKTEPDKSRGIAWTNTCINNLSAYLKKEIFGDANYHVGDRVMAKESVCDRILENNRILKNVRLNTCQEAIITEIKVTPNTFISTNTETQLELNFVDLTLQKDNGEVFVATTFNHSDLDWIRKFFIIEKKAATEIGTKQGWAKYYEMLETLNVSAKGRTFIQRLAYAGTLTVNTAQGSGYENIFINWYNIFGCQNYPHRLRLAYTAITRAKKQAYLLCKKEEEFFTYASQPKVGFFDDEILNKYMG